MLRKSKSRSECLIIEGNTTFWGLCDSAIQAWDYQLKVFRDDMLIPEFLEVVINQNIGFSTQTKKIQKFPYHRLRIILAGSTDLNDRLRWNSHLQLKSRLGGLRNSAIQNFSPLIIVGRGTLIERHFCGKQRKN